MGSSLYELDLELFEDIDSEVGNYFVVGTLFYRCAEGFSPGSQIFSPLQRPTPLNIPVGTGNCGRRPPWDVALQIYIHFFLIYYFIVHFHLFDTFSVAWWW